MDACGECNAVIGAAVMWAATAWTVYSLLVVIRGVDAAAKHRATVVVASPAEV